MILFIDTTDLKSITYATIGDAVTQKQYQIDPHSSHQLLEYLEKFFKQTKFDRKKLKKIVVCSGPGSYTGTRIGVTHALALGFAWNIPVKPIPKEKVPINLIDLNKIKKI